MLSGKDKSLLCNSLVNVLKSCEGKFTQIDLRNETRITGRVDCVSANMNVVMTSATLTNLKGIETYFSELTIRGNNIRFFHVPESIDMIRAIQKQCLSIRKTSNYREKQKRRAKHENTEFQNKNQLDKF